MDSFGEAGGYLRSYSYEASGVTRTCTGTGQNDWYGFGYVVLHYGTSNLDINTQSTLGTTSVVLAGRHHAIHQFTWSTSPGGPVVATAQWLFATGRDHPLFTVTLDASSAGPNAVDADSRAPYGDLAWDGMNGEVAGVSWGDAYQLKTTGSGPVTPSSAWDYTTPNTIPYAMEWSTAVDAEMGLVATQAWSTRVQGGDYGDGLLAEKWGTTGTALLTDLPEWLWPFQLNQYDLADETTSHRVAWGATFGAVGQTTYQAFGKTLSGYPRYSYSLFVVLGLHSEQAVGAEVGDIEAVQGSSLTASRGVVSTEGPAGVARTDSAPYVPAGFDPVYAAWDATMASSAATLTLTVGSGSLESPMFHLHGYTSSTPPSSVTLGGRALAADTDYFATVDAATQSLWITLATAVSGSVTVTVDP
jgi:hypothetical protein